MNLGLGKQTQEGGEGGLFRLSGNIAIKNKGIVFLLSLEQLTKTREFNSSFTTAFYRQH
jgi:hypothetical protein